MVSISRFKKNISSDSSELKYIIYRDARMNQEYYKEVRSDAERLYEIIKLNMIPEIERVRSTPFKPKRALKR